MENNRTKWYKEAIIYQIYPYSFMDSNGDGIGDIKGIMSKLDYLENLGITAIWFSPLYPSPDKDYGYDISDYKNIAPHFGTLEEFKTLLDECHKRGIKVIMDSVMNHTSSEHAWFKDVINNPSSKYRDYYIIRKGIKNGKKLLPPNNWTSVFTGSAWEKLPSSDDEFYLHLFTKEQPDLNWDNPKVREEMVDIFNFWFDMGVDGFRMDVFNVFSKVDGLPSDNALKMSRGSKYYIDGPHEHEYLHELYEKSFKKYDSLLVGESFGPHPEDKIRYASEASEEIDMLFDFAHLKSDNRNNYFKKKFDILEFKKGLATPQINLYGKGWNSLVLENHDTPRSISRFDFNSTEYHYEVSTMLPLITFFGFGTPFIFEGEEIGMTNCLFTSIDECMDPVTHFIHTIMKKLPMTEFQRMKMISFGCRDNARTPMQWDDTLNAGFTKGKPWEKVNPNYKEINVKNDLASVRSIYHFYQSVIFLKKSNKTLIYGDFHELSKNSKEVFSYLRSLEGNTLFIIANFTDETVEYKLPKEIEGKTLTSLLSNYNDTELKDGIIVLNPYQATCYEIKEENDR